MATDSNNSSDLIPCEICEELIHFQDYQRHLESCITNRLFSINFAIDDRNRRVHDGTEDETENEIDDRESIESSDFDMPPPRNILTGSDFRHFADELFRGYTRRSAGEDLNVVFVRVGEGTLGIVEPSEYEYNLSIAERLGCVEVGLDDVSLVITELPKDKVDKDDICPICRESLISDDIKACSLKTCHHKYCEECIGKWLKSHKKCPVCMTDLEDAQQKLQEAKIENII